MSRPRLRYEAGGDPTRGPARELAADAPTPDELNDFPDAPDQRGDAPVQDRPDLDAFAERLGLSDDQGSRSSETTGSKRRLGSLHRMDARELIVGGTRNAAARAFGTVGVGFRAAAGALDRLATAIAPR